MKSKILYPDYTNSILNVTSTLLKHYQAHTIYPSIPYLEESLTTNSKHVLLVLLDGMGINIINKYLKPEDFLRKNVKKVITSVFPPTTVAATNAVLSGLPPYSSGYLGWVQYFKHEKTNHIVFKDTDFYDEGRVFVGSLKDKYLKYPTIYEQIERANPNIKTYELFPSFRENGFESFEKQVDHAIDITRKDEQNFSYIYWTEPDFTEHDHGTDSKETKDMLVSLNKEVERLSQSISKDTTLIVIADHGFMNVKGIDLYENTEIIRCLKRKPSMEPRATNFFVKIFQKRKFVSLFKRNYGRDFQLFSKKELYASGLLGDGEKHPLLDDFLGNYIAVSISDKMFNFKEHSHFKGHHAGLTKGEMQVPLIIFQKD